MFELYAKVAIDLPIPLSNNLGECFYYKVPEEIKNEIKTGSIVSIPFGHQELIGFVIDIISTPNGKNLTKTNAKEIQFKSIYEIIYKNQIWDEKFLKLAEWISKYYLTNIGTVLASSISSDIFNHFTVEAEIKQELSKVEIEQFTQEQRFILNKFSKSKKKNLSYRFLQQKSKISKQRFYHLINQLKSKGIIVTKFHYKEVRNQKPETKNSSSMLFSLQCFNSPILQSSNPPRLNKAQENSFNTIIQSLNKNESKTFLLHGVTGSGKTEVYLRLIEEVLKKNKKIIYLVPEIYLIPQIYQRLSSRFNPSYITIWHSSLTKKQRIKAWEELLSTKIILGARSAILAPVQNIGLVVIDEAHDASYKQSSPAPRYDTLKVAIKRGEIENCPIVLGSATPNISDYYFCQEHRTILTLPHRIENVPMPKVHLIDLKNQASRVNKNIISSILQAEIKEALNKKEQTILLLNRRGYSSHVFCRACGYIQFCKNCSVPMTFHKNSSLMICHHCGNKKSTNNDLTFCPNCSSPHFKYFGIGTQQLEEEVKKIFTDAKIIRVDKDQLSKKDEYIKLWLDFVSGKADILIGTQLVSKGLDLPNVTVVGVILADTMLNFPDYVSHERAFQLLTQVTGRAGRGTKPGKVFIQTYQIENQIFKFIQDHDFNNFYRTELRDREQFLYPPFCNLTRLIFQSYDEKECLEYAKETLKVLTNTYFNSPISQQVERVSSGSQSSNTFFLGPAPCFFTKLHNKYRYHILCKTKNEDIKSVLFNNLLQSVNKNAKVELIIDVNSVNLL